MPGLWVCRQAITDNIQAYEVTDQMALNRNLKLKGQYWLDLRVYSVPMDECMDTIPAAMNLLSAAWNAAARTPC